MLTKWHKSERKCRGEKKPTVVRKLIEENVCARLELQKLIYLKAKREWTIATRPNRGASYCKVCTMPVI